MPVKQLIPHFIQEQFLGAHTSGHLNAYTIFIDLSGFTPLTETLMKEGNEGAEELSTSLNNIFEPMVRIVYQNKGFIPYFAGDAFTGIFEHTKNPIEVIQTACQLRALFVQEGIKKTRFGNFEIGIKIGISFGEVRWGIVGKQLNSFYFRGPGIDNSAAAEHHASGQEIILDQHILKKIPTQKYQLEDLGNGYSKLLSTDVESNNISDEFQIPSISGKALRNFLPKSIVRFNEAGEFRRVTTIFIAFDGITNHKDFDKFTTLVLDQFNTFSGYFKEIDFGDKGGVMLGFFGAPISFENNTERVLELALAIKEGVEVFSDQMSIKVKMGITVGLAFTGIIGGAERCQYAAVGNRVNIAARLMVKAAWGEILVDEEIRKAKQYKFVHKGDIQYKGVAADIPTYVFQGRKVLIKSGYKGGMKGRKKTLNKLLNFIVPVLDGRYNALVYIFGEAGSGKSRLTFELRKKLKKKRDLTWIICQADQILQKPFNPFISALSIFFDQAANDNHQLNLEKFEENFNMLDEDLAVSSHGQAEVVRKELLRTRSVLAAQMGIIYENSLWSQLDAKGRYQNINSALTSFFLALSISRPLVIELEDGHWYDESSQEFLNSFSKKIAGFSIALVATSRYEDDGTKKYLIPKEVLKENFIHLKRINLKNLSLKAITRVLKQKLEGATHPDFDLAIHQLTDGNPFYLEQVIAYYQEENLLVEESGRWNLKENHGVFSDSINAILMARIDRLSDLVKATVKTAAVIGREFEIPILSAVLKSHEDFDFNSPNTIIEQISAAEKGQIWQAMNEIKYIFRHALLREAVYEMQLRTQLRKLHLTISESIEKIYEDNLSEKYIDLAFHYEQAEVSDKTNFYLEKTANFAKSNFQNAQALKYYDRLLNKLDAKKEGEKVAPVLLSKGGVLELIGQWDTGEEIYKKGLKIALKTDNGLIKGRAHTKLGHLLLLKGDYKKARTHFDHALEFFSTRKDQIGIVRVTGNLGNLYFRQGDYKQAIEYFERTIAGSETLPYHTANAQIVANLGLTYMNLGRYDEGIEEQKKQLEKSEKNGDRRGMATLYVNQGIVYFEKGDFENALSCYEKGLDLSQKLGNKLLTSIAIGCIGSVYQQQGDYQKAADHFIQDLELCEQLGDKQGIAIALGLIGELRSIEGEFDLAVDYLNHCCFLCEELGYQKGIAKAVNNLADIYYLKEDYSTSITHYEKAIRIARNIKNRLILCSSLLEKAQTLLDMQDPEEAPHLVSEAHQIADSLGNPDLSFHAQLLQAQIFHYQGTSTEGIRLLEELLLKNQDDERRANLYFELNKLAPHHKTARLRALELYKTLYTKTPKFIYQKRINHLSE